MNLISYKYWLLKCGYRRRAPVYFILLLFVISSSYGHVYTSMVPLTLSSSWSSVKQRHLVVATKAHIVIYLHMYMLFEQIYDMIWDM